jgi:hypothetical protein
MRFNVDVVCSCMLTYGWRSSLAPSTAVYTVCGFLYDGPCQDECAWTIGVSLM